MTSKWTKISSPNYPNEFNEGQECSWLFVAPKGQQVQLEFLGEFEIYCKIRHSLCMDYLEIKNSTDFANTGMRYCCFGTPNSSILSATEDMLVLFRSFYRGGKGFQAQVRAVPAPGRWGEWSNFSTCSQTCGACGSRVRTRKCTTAFCPSVLLTVCLNPFNAFKNKSNKPLNVRPSICELNCFKKHNKLNGRCP